MFTCLVLFTKKILILRRDRSVSVNINDILESCQVQVLHWYIYFFYKVYVFIIGVIHYFLHPSFKRLNRNHNDKHVGLL